MATVTSGSLSAPAASHNREHRRRAGLGAFWRQFLARAFDPYRPELHYMRGPGPACRARQEALSPAVQSMIVEIRAATSRSSGPL